MVDYKNVSDVLRILPRAKYYFTQASIPRALPVQKLMEAANLLGMKGEAFNSGNNAVESALDNAEQDDLIFVGGSTFVVADFLVFWKTKI